MDVDVFQVAAPGVRAATVLAGLVQPAQWLAVAGDFLAGHPVVAAGGNRGAGATVACVRFHHVAADVRVRFVEAARFTGIHQVGRGVGNPVRHFMADHVDRTEVIKILAAVADEHAFAAGIVKGIVVGIVHVHRDIGGGIVAIERLPAEHVLVGVVGVHQAPQRVDGGGLAVGVGGAAARNVLLAVAPGVGAVGVHVAGAGVLLRAVVGVGDRHAAELAAGAARGVEHLEAAAVLAGADRHGAVVLAVAGA